ncbi:MAG: HEPN domain-containing protein [Candidatus Thorarchaeota archaeon]
MINSDLEACKWFALALNNFQRALKMEVAKDFPSSIFYFQQAIEFYTKSIIVFINAEPKRSHDPGQQLKALVPKDKLSSQLQELFDLSAELSQDYLVTRYPGDKSPWDIYNEKSIVTTKNKVKKVFKSTKTILMQLLPNRLIDLDDCLTKAITNPELNRIYKEMRHYFN